MTRIDIQGKQKFTINGLIQDYISEKQHQEIVQFYKDYTKRRAELVKSNPYQSEGYETDCTIHSAGKDGRCLICNELI